MINLSNLPQAQGLNAVIEWFQGQGVNLPGFVLRTYYASNSANIHTFESGLIAAFRKVHGASFKNCPLWPNDGDLAEMVYYLVYVLESEGLVYSKSSHLYGLATLRGIHEATQLRGL